MRTARVLAHSSRGCCCACVVESYSSFLSTSLDESANSQNLTSDSTCSRERRPSTAQCRPGSCIRQFRYQRHSRTGPQDTACKRVLRACCTSLWHKGQSSTERLLRADRHSAPRHRGRRTRCSRCLYSPPPCLRTAQRGTRCSPSNRSRWCTFPSDTLCTRRLIRSPKSSTRSRSRCTRSALVCEGVVGVGGGKVVGVSRNSHLTLLRTRRTLTDLTPRLSRSAKGARRGRSRAKRALVAF